MDDNLDIEETMNENRMTLKVKKKNLTSEDLNIDFDSSITNIFIKCINLNIDADLPSNYRGKNIDVSAKKINVLKKSFWNVSGRDASAMSNHQINEDGDEIAVIDGENGGNINVYCDNITNFSLWKFELNGGNGLNGQNGICGKDGVDGRNAQIEDLSILGENVIKLNHLQLREKLNVSTETDSLNITIHENDFEKRVIFNKRQNDWELLMLVKGSKGGPGELGGFGSLGGRGGKHGKINKNLKNDSNDGKSGEKGQNGFDGRDGRSGGDVYVILKAGMLPEYGGLTSRMKFEISSSKTKIDKSVYYNASKKYMCIKEIQESSEENQQVRSSREEQEAKIAEYKEKCYNALGNVLKYSNKHFYDVAKKIKIREFLKNEIDFKTFATVILANSFKIQDYENLKNCITFLMNNLERIEKEVLEILQEYISDPIVTMKTSEECEIRGKILTSEDIENVRHGFLEIIVLCDILHINSNLSDKFRCKNIKIFSNSICVHNEVVWDLSGWSKTSMWIGDAEVGIEGNDSENGDNGGEFLMECIEIINPSYFTIISNGGNGSDGQNGGANYAAVNGRNPTINDFVINGAELTEGCLMSIKGQKFWTENGFQKCIYVKSKKTYLMLVKGTLGCKPQKGCAGGNKGIGGKCGKIAIKTSNINELKSIASNGLDGNNGASGSIGQCEFRDGYDIVLYVQDGIKNYVNINKPCLYEILSSEIDIKNSVKIVDRYHFPKITHYMENPNTIQDDLNLLINLISVLRNAYNMFEDFINKIELKDFFDNKITLRDVVYNISRCNPRIEHYEQLKRIAFNYQIENTNIHDFIRTMIGEYIKQIDVLQQLSIVTIRKKVLQSSEFCHRQYNPEVNEFRIICDILHIDCDFPELFRGKNVVILSNFVVVHKKSVWNLSGKDVCTNQSDVGQENDGKGKNGADGQAGKNGGHFLLECMFIENGSLLEIISNGSDGADGQKGGDGKNGKNGQDAVKSDFIVNGSELKSTIMLQFDTSGKFNIKYHKLNYHRAEFISGNGLDGYLYRDGNAGVIIVLVKGGKGEQGKLGGLGGFGGDPGHKGKIDIKCENYVNDEIKTSAKDGKFGKNGLNGMNGVHGRDGGDIHKFDQGLWISPFMEGDNRLTKFKIIQEDEPFYSTLVQFATLGFEQASQHRVSSPELGCYLKVVQDTDYEIPSSQRFRNDSILSRSKQSHAISNRSAEINIDSIRNANQEYLSTSMNEIYNEISQFNNEFLMPERKTKSMKKVKTKENQKIDIDSLRNEYQCYLKSNICDVIKSLKVSNASTSELQLSTEESQHLMDRFTVSNVRPLSLDEREINNSQRIRIINATNQRNSFSYGHLISVVTVKPAADCFEFIKSEHLDDNQYLYLILNMEKLQIIQSRAVPPLKFLVLKDKIESSLENDNAPQYILSFINVLKDYTTMNQIHVRELCEEKYLSLIYKEIYNFFNKREQPTESNVQISFTSSTFSSKVSFLSDTKTFNGLSKDLNEQFSTNSKIEKNKIIKFFNKNNMDFTSPLPESIFNHVINRKILDEDISKVVVEFIKKTHKFDDEFRSYLMNANEAVAIQELLLQKRIEFSQILKDFFSKKEISNFIKTELKDQGINSPIYRKIVSHKYGVKLVLFRYSLDNKIRIFEWHNYNHDLRFKYNDNQTDLKELFILKDNQKFTILDLDKMKYENFAYKTNIDEDLKQTALVLEGLKSGKIDSLSFSFAEENNLQFLNEIGKKLKNINNKFATIFQIEDLMNDEEFLYDVVISTFPDIFWTVNNDVVEVHEVDDNNINEIQKSDNFYQDNKDKVHKKIKILFKLIEKIEGISILKALAIKLSNNKNMMRIEEFLTLLNSIFMIVWKKESFVTTLTFMILGMEQEMWIPEIILIKIDSIFGVINPVLRTKWSLILQENKRGSILPIFLQKILNSEECEDFESKNIEEFDQIIDNLTYFDENNIDILIKTNLFLWGTITTEKFWNEQWEKLGRHQKNIEDELKIIFEDLSSKYGSNSKQLIEIFIEKEKQILNIQLKDFCSNFINGKWLIGDKVLDILKKHNVVNWTDLLNNFFNCEQGTLNVEKIAELVNNDNATSTAVKEKIGVIKLQTNKVIDRIKELNNTTEDELKKLLTDSTKDDEVELLAIITRVIELKAKVELRETQLFSILTMYHSGSGILMQVSTGEGKTITAVAFAILKKIIDNQKVDIVTSSSVLAIRDATNSVNKDIFDFFNINVGHNCHEKGHERQQAYYCDIVYGTLCNFQRDYLLTEFHEKKIMKEHKFDNVLVDEVDSMLLDKGNNILYLSQDLPDLDELEGIFIFIWKWINQSLSKVEDVKELLNINLIRKMILDVMFGILDEDDVVKMQGNAYLEHIEAEISDYAHQETTSAIEQVKRNAKGIIKKLKDINIVGEENIICEENFKKEKIEFILNEFEENLVHKITTFLRNKIESQKQLKVPKHLKSFVHQHLNQWIESGIRALYLQNGREYIIDNIKTTRNENDPNVNIIDLDTGTDMLNSQWDQGLHQFLQIKYGCKLSPLSLKSVFISNVSYFKKYKKLYGMTGTLGSLMERQKITKIHNIDFATIPRYSSRQFVEYLPKKESLQDEWIESIREEVKSMKNKDRALLIIGKTIQDTQVIEKAIQNDMAEGQLHLYQRDSDKFDISELEAGHVIISTNLAGRGTDIKLSKRLKETGGLHVILTYLPDNSRIEEQAFGRAARSGEKGTGRLIILGENDEPVSKLKEIRNQAELQRLDEISSYYLNFIKIEEDFFKKFQEAYWNLKNESKENQEVYLLNLVIQWSFWLDQNSKLLDNWKNNNNKKILQNKFNDFISKRKVLHPVMRIEIFKELVSGSFKDIKYAENFLNEDFHDDLFTHQFLKLYGMMKKNSEKNSFKTRELSDEEEKQISKCLQMLRNSMQNREINILTVKNLTQNMNKNENSMNAFEAQQKEILEMYEEISRNLKLLMGGEINPNILGSLSIDKDVMKNHVFEKLIKIGCIEPPKINEFYFDSDLQIIGTNNKIKFDDIKEFLRINHSLKIKSIKKFEDEIKKKFPLPNRTDFWNELLGNGIIENEVVYAIVDMNIIKNVDPSAGELIQRKYHSEIFPEKTDSVIFFSEIDDDTEYETERIVLNMSSFKSEFVEKRREYLMENNVFTTNKVAHLNNQKFNDLQKEKVFEQYDSITIEDFEDIGYDEENIVDCLTSPDIGILTKRGDSYALVYENFKNFKNPYILKENYVYYSEIYKLLSLKFAYRIAIESIIERIHYGDKSPIIRLDITPHASLLKDLLYFEIIQQAKVDEAKLNECDKMFDDYSMIEIFAPVSVDATKEFNEELIRNDLIDEKYKIKDFNINNINFSKKFKHIESTTALLLQNQRILQENTKYVKETLKSSIKPLLRKDLESLEVVLVPIETFLPENNYLQFMKIKGHESIIKIQQKMYSRSYWIKFGIVVLFALVQIIAGAALISSGIGGFVGTQLISEGIGDAIFALSTLKTGYFNWSDYGLHKAISVATSLTCYGISTLFSKLKWFNIPIPLSNNTSLLKSVFKITLITCKNTAIKFGVSMAAGYIITQYINKVTTKIVGVASHLIKIHFDNHEIIQTIEKMLKFFDIMQLKNIIKENFQVILKDFSQTMNKLKQVFDTATHIFDTCMTSMNLASILASSVSNTVQAATTYFKLTSLIDNLNASLEKILNTKRKEDEITNNLNKEETRQFKADVAEQLKSDITLKCTELLNMHFIQPILSNAGKSIVSNNVKNIERICTDSTNVNPYRDIWRNGLKMHNVTSIQRNANNLMDTNISKKIVRDVMYFSTNTSENLRLFRGFMDDMISCDQISIECVRLMLQNKLGRNYKFIVNKSGNEQYFGSSYDTNVIIIELSLINDYFENSRNINTGNDSLYYALCDQDADIEHQITPENISDSVKMIINGDDNMKKSIKNYNEEFYMEIDFCRDQIFVPRLKNEYGSYQELKRSLLSGKEKEISIDHIPEKSTYTEVWIHKNGEMKKLSDEEKPSILLPKIIYDKLLANGSSTESKKFIAHQSKYSQNKEFEKAIAMQLIDQHNVAVKIYKGTKNFNSVICRLHRNQEKLVHYCYENEYICEEKKNFLLNIVRDLTLHRVIEVENPFFKFN